MDPTDQTVPIVLAGSSKESFVSLDTDGKQTDIKMQVCHANRLKSGVERKTHTFLSISIFLVHLWVRTMCLQWSCGNSTGDFSGADVVKPRAKPGALGGFS